ncbi:acetyl-CoA C-acyltransferase [Inquilinus sp.]|uniref:acetyl-CoA C-acyltransferase n=1 Tax=Inquilinus sp. TaxID=1932117 RepID=UPI0031CDF709
MSSTDSETPRRFYHGTRADLKPGDLIAAGSADIVVTGGMESMSNAPWLLPGVRDGLRFGHGRIFDHAALDGLEDAYDKGRAMGDFGEATAARYGFTRAEQDAYAAVSLQRAQAAIASGAFAAEIVPVTVPAKGGPAEVAVDENPRSLSADKIPGLKPAFRPDGTITAASSSANADGAAALVLARRSVAERQGLPVLATIRAHATHSQAPEWFTTAPIGAIRRLLDRAGWRAGEVDLFEINEAFACVVMAAMRDLDLPHDKVNIHGGACALGHPIGATGARLIVTLLAAMQRHGLRRGVASLCIGGGEATAIAIERS